jgi:hypothetical protein
VRFLHAAWPVIHHDIMCAFDAFWSLDTRHLHCTNDVLMVLLLKKADPSAIKDYRPIALIHSMGKLITKVLACRLAPKLDNLVHVIQSTFIKGRFIQDNFKLVQSTAKVLHTRRVAYLLLKIDIAHAFELVSWPFLL